MARTISYADAVRILGGGPESAVYQRVNTMTGGLLAGAAVAAPQLLALLDLRTELARVSGELVTTAARAMVGSGRRDRTDRLAAAHTVIVIAAYFDAIAEVDLSWTVPLPKPGLSVGGALTRQDQLRLAGQGADGARDLTSAALRAGVPLPEPHVPNEQYLAGLDRFYDRLTADLGRFLAGLAPFDELSEGERTILLRDIHAGGRRARRRYDEMLLNLMADCPDMALWIDHRHRHVIEGRLDALEPSLRELERLLRAAAAENEAEGVAKALQRAHAAMLEHRIVESIDLPDGLDVPTLERGYIPPAFQVAERTDASPVDEAFWRTAGVRHDIDRFLAGYLGSPRALRAPMLVLGQPGAGKSVLTRILAARLATTRFLPIRVPLRDVDSSLPLQRQIEQAVLAATSEETTWPALARSIDAVPVVIFDGFDELLQATGVSQSDFLQKAAEFQQREREQGRAAAVIVTSRTSVADRAALPAETMLLRLQPFDEPRIRGWVDAWNEANTVHLAAEDVLAHRDLAAQPLLLLMLALYDSDGNALRRDPGGPLTTGELYEQLVTGFARREVGKAFTNLSPRGLDALAEQDLTRLAVVAFAMLNRSAQWVTEEAVGDDLRATLGDPAPGRTPPVSADALTEQELIFGRFFFVHRAQAVRHGATRRAYEFLHSTFGEYLVARFTWQLLAEAVARDAVTVAARPITGDNLLADLLSVQTLTSRAPIVQFLAEMAARMAPEERELWTDVLIRMFRQCERSGDWPASAYRPAPGKTVAARFAAYTANLMLLAVVTSGGLRFGELAEPAHYEPFRQWHDHAMLWHGQLNNDGWGTLVQTLAVERCIGPGGRDGRLTLDDGTFAVPPVDPHWLYRRPESERGRDAFVDQHEIEEVRRRRVFFQGCMSNELMWHTVEPLLGSALAPTTTMFASWWPESTPSAAQALMAVWLLPTAAPGPDVAETYRRCVRIAAEFPGWDPQMQIAYADTLLRTLAGHHDCPTEVAVDLLGGLTAASPDEWLRTATAVLDRAERDDPNAAWLAGSVLKVVTDGWAALTDRPGAIVASARAVALLERRRRPPDVLGKLGRTRVVAGADEMRGELEAFRVRLASLRTTNERWLAELNALFDEYSWLAAGSAQLHASLVALARMPDMVGDIETVLAYVDQRIGNWLVGNP
ncbi:NACHT domain-containing protein [Paractinoplanes rhizophilus]|uniref:NACHT domain-containing protein n=1 Tax=Paractinoplanes rhizophilus TaxID=1416877 RepID=A0ABW2HLC4_9ACTN